jgi:hypothetical protein
VIIESGAVLNRRRDPDRTETELFDVVEALNQPFKISAPVRIFRFAGFWIEFDAVAAKKVVRRIAIIETRSD